MQITSDVQKAIKYCEITTLKRLLVQSPDSALSYDEWGNRPMLFYAVEKDTFGPQTEYRRTSGKLHMDMTKLLLLYGANVNATDKDGRTALFIAVTQGHIDMVKLLLTNSANPNVQDNLGDSPLHAIFEELLVTEGHEEMSELLLTYGADPNIRNKAGILPIDLAKAYGAPEVIQILLQHM